MRRAIKNLEMHVSLKRCAQKRMKQVSDPRQLAAYKNHRFTQQFWTSDGHEVTKGFAVAQTKSLEGRPYTENAYIALTYTKTGFHGHQAISRTHRRFHVHTGVFTIFTFFHVHSWFFHVHLHTFSRTYFGFHFHVHTVIFEFIWPNGLWTHFSCPNGPPGHHSFGHPTTLLRHVKNCISPTVLSVRRARSDERVVSAHVICISPQF